MLSALLALSFGALPAPAGAVDFAYAVAHAGDVDDDGYGDVLVGWRNGGAWVGLYRGSAQGLVNDPVWVAVASSFASAGDVDGDGYGDIILGDPGFVFDDDVVGRAVLHFGGPGGVDDQRPPWIVVGESPDERLGAAVGAAGDFDGDGLGDVIIGSPGYDHGRGRARIFRGDYDRPIAGPAWVGLGDAVGAAFGAAVGTVWDVDADGRSDTVVSAAGGAGLGAMVYLFGATEPAWSISAQRIVGIGDADGDSFADLVVTASTSAVHFGGRDFGARVPRPLDDRCPLGPAGDVNGDGYADVVGSAIYFGTPVGPGAAARALEGCGTGVGDVDGDGFGDVMVGAVVVRGAWTGLAAEAEWRFDDVRQVVAARDVEGDGFDDLLIGTPTFTSEGLTERGRAQLYRGSATGPAGVPSWTHLGDAGHELLGTALAGAGDIDGDGFADIVVTSPGANPEREATGKAQVFWGSSAGVAPERAPGVVVPHEAEQMLGVAAAGVGDLDGDGLADIVIGIHDEPQNGALDVYLGEVGTIASARSWRAPGARNGDPKIFLDARPLGDVNDDGFADFGLYLRARPTESVLYFGDPVDVVVASGITWGGTSRNDYNQVAGAGDFDGDGRGDLVFSHHLRGDYAGVVEIRDAAMTVLRIVDGAPGDEIGAGIDCAGDVDGDGFADVIVGAPFASASFLHAGRASILFGGADATRTWSFDGGAKEAWLGELVAGLGDLDGDGFPEVSVYSRESRVTARGGHVRVFRGNGGLGFAAAFPYRVRARRPGTGVAIPAWGTSDSVDGFDISAQARSAHGVGRVALEAEVRGNADRFIGVVTQRTSTVWSDRHPAELLLPVRGLAENRPYRWRARVRVDPAQAPIQGWSRWLYGGLPGQPSGVHVRTSKNHAPVVRDESYQFNEDENGKGWPAPGLLANDLDRDGDVLTATKLTEARHGRVTVLSDGGWFYVPDDGYRGPDGFDYRVSDSRGGSADGHVELYVEPGSDCSGASRMSCEAGEFRAVIAATNGPLGLRCRVSEGAVRTLSCTFDERPGSATCETP